ncbi:MAG: outer membrane beta-barrel protein [Cellvibrionaceae bacterium]|uniref:OmpW/AlkL family protein n=1 Tax=uncultured Pseudoteredinibacter sp. TaxID=1641701 RepID=UPI002607AC78|nr:OmpW family outer membrane protein [uncultured Pseudoteredinibacter sp.]MCV6623876.1 outer membrane beta-barrel protein [Cellvibrionaceae bacterium]
MKATLKPLTLAAAIAACVVGTQAHAYEAGDFIVRAGVTTVAPDGDSTQVYAGGNSLGADSGVDVDNDTQLGLTFTYMLDKAWGVEVLAATPFSHDASGEGSFLNGAGIGSVADTKQLPPTVSAVYYFNSDSAFKPYVGLGLNYTIFFDEEGGSNLEAVTGDLDVDLDDSWGLAAQVGFDLDLGDNLLLNASVRYIDIDTEATLTVKNSDNALSLPAGTKITTDVNIDPMVYSVMIGYKF